MKLFSSIAKRFGFGFFTTLVITSSLSIEVSWAISETHYHSQFYSSVLPHFKSAKLDYFIGKNENKIAYTAFENPHEIGALVILPGRGLPMINYSELIYDLDSLGLSTYIMDHRGQGFSDRSAPHSKVQYVEKFQDYVDDLQIFMRKVVQAKSHKKVILLAESMGGAIGTLYQIQNPTSFDGVILSAPMFGVVGLSELSWLASPIANSKINSGQGSEYFFHEQETIPFAMNLVTSSQERYEVRLDLYREFPDTTIDGVSYQWMAAILDGMSAVQSNLKSYSAPTLILQAGKDLVAKKSSQKYFCQNTPHCQLMLFPESMHELLFERDEIRNQVLEVVQNFIRDLLSNITYSPFPIKLPSEDYIQLNLAKIENQKLPAR